MPVDPSALAFSMSAWVLPILLAVTMHEAAHGWVAMKLGDPTANAIGRVTFNPFKHIDPIGTVVVPGLMLLATGGKATFGFAKPVPIKVAKLRSPMRDSILVAAAGPGMNLVLAMAAAVAFHALPLLDGATQDWVGHNLGNMLWLNILLAIFNMLPVPPLDGGRVLIGLLPWSIAHHLVRFEQFGLFVVLFGVFLLPLIGGMIGVDLNVFMWVVLEPAEYVQDIVMALAGFR